MAEPVKLYPGATDRVFIGGLPLVAIYGNVLSAYIENPVSAQDQGLLASEVLYVDPTGPATLAASQTTVVLQPGQGYTVPAGQTSSVWVNARSNGHKFSAFLIQEPTPFPPAPVPGQGQFPPDGPQGLVRQIPSYLYQQYSDDDDLQAFVASYNGLTQQFLDTFNGLNLPVYTGASISGDLLDWVAAGLYGLPRPALYSGLSSNLGPMNTYEMNTLEYNQISLEGFIDVAYTTDDVFKRILTWHFLKSDGKVFNVRWLKRRIMRFLYGTNGVNFNVDQTYNISVTFGVDREVSITFISGTRTVTGGAFPNRFELNQMEFNELDSVFAPVAPLPNSGVFKEAVASGVLELPFQFNYVVTI